VHAAIDSYEAKSMNKKFRSDMLLVICASIAWSSLASAQGGGDPAAAPVDTSADAGASASEAARREASVHFRMGVSLYEEGDFQGALAEFERANQAAPSPVVLYNVAQTYLALRDYVAASDALTRYLELGGSRLPATRRAEVAQQLDMLSMRIGRIRIVCNVDDATITVDGTPRGRTPLDSPLRVSLGRHQVVVRAAMREPDERTVTVAGNSEVIVDVDLPAAPSAVVAEAPPRTLRTVGWAAIATGIGAGIAGGTTFGLAMRARSRYQDATASSPADVDAALGARDDVRRLSLASDITTGVAIAAGGTGIVLCLVDRARHRGEDPTSTVLVAPTRHGVVVSGRF
jgi:tetratricopeptide (TPR) repeat protein